MSFENKYAPQSWNDLVFADTDVCDELEKYANGRTFDHILLHGPHGSGKSQTAKVVAASSYGRTVDQVQFDIVEHVDEIKDAIRSWRAGARFGHTCMMHQTTRPYAIIQEVDAYEAKTQLKLRALMDTMSQARFIFTTNHRENVDNGIRNRCDCFELAVPDPASFVGRARAICAAEGVILDDATLRGLLVQSGTSVREYMRALEKVVVGVRAQQQAA
jgi:DNA polymerase III delta prime subunit